MATLLADSPSAPPDEQAPPNGSAGTTAAPAPDSPPAPSRTCAKCGAVMADDQDWCLQCGAGAPGSLGTPSWRSAAAILGATVLLVLVAAAAAYAALSKSGGSHASSTTVARVTPPAATAPSTPATTATTPPPGTLGTTPTPTASVPTTAIKTPKIPLTAVVPKTTTTTTTPSGSSGTGTSTTTTPSTPATGGSGSEESAPSAIVLDTNAASTYNPYSYPASGFGDPSLAIDGDSTTAWTAKLDPATALKMAQGLLLDLKTKQKLAAVGLTTSTPGMIVQVYGAKGATAPASITDPAWVALSPSLTVKKKHTRIKLRDSKQTFTFVTLWISGAPQASAGTPEAPGHVDVNELELFPAGR